MSNESSYKIKVVSEGDTTGAEQVEQAIKKTGDSATETGQASEAAARQSADAAAAAARNWERLQQAIKPGQKTAAGDQAGEQVVSIRTEGDTTGAEQVKRAIDQVGSAAAKSAEESIDAAGKTKAAYGGLVGTFSAVTSSALVMWTAITGGITAAIALLGSLMGAVSGAARMEAMEASFTTLLGSVKAAKERLQELKEFTDTTPFEFRDVAQASKVLQNLTNGDLATGDGLRMIGDVAAATDQSFGDLAVTIGRYYQGLKNGQPVGETAARLTELTGINFRQIKSWDEARAAFARYEGEMDRLSKTTESWWLGFKDALGNIGTELGKPLLGAIKPILSAVTILLQGLAKALEWANKLRESMPSLTLLGNRGAGQNAGADATEQASKGLDAFAASADNAADRSKALQAEIDATIERMDRMQDAAGRARARIDDLAKARMEAEKARLDLAVSSGSMSPEDAQRSKNNLEADVALQSINRELAAAERDLIAAQDAANANRDKARGMSMAKVMQPDIFAAEGGQAILDLQAELDERIADAQSRLAQLNAEWVAVETQRDSQNLQIDSTQQAAGESLAAKREELTLEAELAEARAKGLDQEVARLEWLKQYAAVLKATGDYDLAHRVANAQSVSGARQTARGREVELSSLAQRGGDAAENLAAAAAVVRGQQDMLRATQEAAKAAVKTMERVENVVNILKEPIAVKAAYN